MAVQTEDGRRAMDDFQLSCSLKDVVDKMRTDKKIPAPAEGGRVPVVILATNAEVRGEEAMKTSTLQGLGFAAGKRELLKLKYVDPVKEKEVLDWSTSFCKHFIFYSLRCPKRTPPLARQWPRRQRQRRGASPLLGGQ